MIFGKQCIFPRECRSSLLARFSQPFPQLTWVLKHCLSANVSTVRYDPISSLEIFIHESYFRVLTNNPIMDICHSYRWIAARTTLTVNWFWWMLTDLPTSVLVDHVVHVTCGSQRVQERTAELFACNYWTCWRLNVHLPPAFHSNRLQGALQHLKSTPSCWRSIYFIMTCKWTVLSCW